MSKAKLDTQALGLDVGLSFTRWLTGQENLHYGLWDGLEVTAANVGAAQAAYTDKLFTLLPERPCRVLDIGGGAGETARKLIERGHEVDIVVPSAFLAQRCRENAPGARVHEQPFEEFGTERRFDICLFSESFQYIPYEHSIPACLGLLRDGGEIVIADCFRSADFRPDPTYRRVGGGHPVVRFRDFLATQPVTVAFEEDITDAVAPSVEIEQGFFNVLGHALSRVDEELAGKRPRTRWLLHRMLRLFLGARKRARIWHRLTGTDRNRAEFARHNDYLMMILRPTGEAPG